jgi:hypothetical protein
MSTAGKAVIIISLCMLVLGVGVVGAGIYWWAKHGRRVVEAGAKTLEEAEAAGKQTDDQGCLDQALERYRKDQGFGGAISSGIFLQTCLKESRPTPGFCDDVPRPNELIKTTSWQIKKCKEAGLEDQYCRQIFAQVQQYCGQGRAKSKQ